ncbi:hypothetical protein R1flu_022971 [Riccia fluitans]|uniref:Lipase n=1 Tax=Riccia fluitans TaxID=41844 RepID=A0ABD1XR79_9MARC
MWSGGQSANMPTLVQWYMVVAFLAVSSIISLGRCIQTVHAAESSFCGMLRFMETFRFTCAEYRMYSADGFELAMHRVGRKTTADSRAAPVLIMHLEFLNGDSWFQFTDAADRLLPLLLVDAGFDVWIGHERATYWSHGHLDLETTDTRYWDWTWDDHAHYDVPVYLDFINNITGSSVHYIGLSESATAGAATATMLQNSLLIRSLTLIGPTIYIGDTNSIVMAAWAFIFGDIIDEGNYEIGYQSGAFNFSTAFPGIIFINGQGILAPAMGVISGMRTNTWRRFDYGSAANNTQAYGVPTVPTYYPEDIPTYIPILVIYGGNDSYAPPAGVQHLLSHLRNAESVFLPDYAHYDLMWSYKRTQDIFVPILGFLERHR